MGVFGKVVVPVFGGRGMVPLLRSGGVLVLISPCRRVVTGMNPDVPLSPLKLSEAIDQMLTIG